MKSKYIKLVLGLLFLLFAWFQRNDPDPALWIAIYGVLAVLCFVGAFQKIHKYILFVFGGFLLIYTVILVPEIIHWISKGMPSIVEEMKAEEPHIEYTREFFGLVISILSLWFLYKKNEIK